MSNQVPRQITSSAQHGVCVECSRSQLKFTLCSRSTGSSMLKHGALVLAPPYFSACTLAGFFFSGRSSRDCHCIPPSIRLPPSHSGGALLKIPLRTPNINCPLTSHIGQQSTPSSPTSSPLVYGISSRKQCKARQGLYTCSGMCFRCRR
jgi:hypothetical protein